MKKIVSNSILLLLLLLTGIQTFGQETIMSQGTNSKSIVITSSINNKEYILNIMLPKSYSASDSIDYPVLYVLDGRYFTASFYSIKEIFALAKDKEIKDIIFVTIDANVKSESEWLTNRYADFTPSFNPSTDTAIANFFKLPVSSSGGAADFIATIEKDIIPLIENKYKAGKERGIFGHSLGGLFAAYCLCSKPDLFQKYSMNSPSIWWNNGEMITLADSMAQRNPHLKANIFISAGSMEGDFMLVPVNNFIKHLKGNFSNFIFTSEVFEDETHLSVVPAASSRTLKVLYSQQP